jgi:two-component sensor histidine kinase
MRQFQDLEDAQALALAIVETISEPFLVLDECFRVVAASRSFYETFNLDPGETRGRLLYTLGQSQWDIPALRVLLETIIPEHAAMDDFEVDHNFPGLGQKIMLLNARTVDFAGDLAPNILLAFKDITARRAIELEKQLLLDRTEKLLREQQVLLQEMRHRVANSLQVIASILLLKARAVSSEEIRYHLRDAHERVMSVAAIQNHLAMSDSIDRIEVGSYLRKLCSGLGASMVDESRPVLITVDSDQGSVASADAVSLGLIVTELVINAIKYAFPAPAREDARIAISYEVDGFEWKLCVTDNGVGARGNAPTAGGGLGTAIVTALAKQLGAQLNITSSAAGMSVSLARATFTSHLPMAA